MVVKIVPNDKGNPPGKLADAELHFSDGVLMPSAKCGFLCPAHHPGVDPFGPSSNRTVGMADSQVLQLMTHASHADCRYAKTCVVRCPPCVDQRDVARKFTSLDHHDVWN